MITLERKYTTDDFKKIEEGTNCQLINGEIIMTPAPLIKHQHISKIIFKIIDTYVVEKKLGEAYYSPIDVYFNNDNAYQPDILFVAKERLDIIKEDGIYGAPDLIIEILSPSNSNYDLKDKKKIYEKYGVKEYWLVNPINNEVIGYKLDEHKFIEFYKGIGDFTIELLNLKIQLNS